jgi:hypothetical protein
MFRVTLCVVAVAVVAGGNPENEIKDQWKELQTAIKGKDAAKIWPLASIKTQEAAEKIGKGIQEKYAKLDDAGKDKLAKAVGLPKDVLAKMSGQDYFKTAAFYEKYGEIDDSKIDKIVVKGDKATLHYEESDKDKRTLNFVLQDKKWRIDFQVGKVD